MAEWILSYEGTEAGRALAVFLAILAAFLHAVFGALQKGRHDPWLSRGAIDLSYGMIALPFALFVVPWPEPALWPLLGATMLVHITYKILQAMAYSRGAYTVVYPVVRGTSPFFAVVGAYVLFGETFNTVQWLGVAVLMTGIFGLAGYNLRHIQVARGTLPAALMLAAATGLFVALYTAVDAYGIRAAVNPLTFLMWFFLLDGVNFLPFTIWRWRHIQDKPALGPLALRGAIGGVVALCSFGSIMLATLFDKVGEVAVLRETSTIFAALIGWLLLREYVGPIRVLLMALIALGAVIVEMGG